MAVMEPVRTALPDANQCSPARGLELRARRDPPRLARMIKIKDAGLAPWWHSCRLSQNREVSMIRLVTRGRFSHDFVKAIIDAPEDREPAVRKLIEGAGGKVISYYVTTGETDFLLISEANEAEAIIAALMAASAAGTISHVSTVRAWSAAEFKGIAERAGKAAESYRPPGKK
jgi:uncharacterized protein with GYD domain